MVPRSLRFTLFPYTTLFRSEILVVDEVLAVGDVDFQKKSLGKMEDITKKGRAVLFVSHNIGAIMNLCKRGLLLDKRSEEHTSELQSPCNLVCRLLLEKKNKE